MTPLIDVVLVLLIIFMVLTPLAEKQKFLRVPEYQPEHAAVPPDQVPPDQTILTVLKNGRVLLNKQELEVEDAMSRSTTAYDGRPSKLLFFNAEDDVKYDQAFQVLDAAHSRRREHHRHDDRPAHHGEAPSRHRLDSAGRSGRGPPLSRRLQPSLGSARSTASSSGSGLSATTRPPPGASMASRAAWRKWRESPGSAAAAPP